MLVRIVGGLLALPIALVLGYFGFQRYVRWLVSGQTGDPAR